MWLNNHMVRKETQKSILLLSIALPADAMMTSSNGNIFALKAFVSGIYLSPVDATHKGQSRGTLMFLWSAPEHPDEQPTGTPVIWDATALIMTSLWRAWDSTDEVMVCYFCIDDILRVWSID